MSKKTQFYASQMMVVALLTLVLLFLMIIGNPVIKTLSILLVFMITGLITPFSSKKKHADIERLAIQGIDKKSFTNDVLNDMPLAIVGGSVLALTLLMVNAVHPFGGAGVAMAIVVTSCIAPLFYRGAEAASIKYAEALK